MGTPRTSRFTVDHKQPQRHQAAGGFGKFDIQKLEANYSDKQNIWRKLPISDIDLVHLPLDGWNFQISERVLKDSGNRKKKGESKTVEVAFQQKNHSSSTVIRLVS